MHKGSNSKIFLLFFVLTLSTIILSTIPTSNAVNRQILAGYYYYSLYEPGCTRCEITWSVISGPNIDVYILTQSQFTAWGETASPPPSATYMNVGTSGGSYNTALNDAEWYYFVFSNVGGGSDVIADIEVNVYVPKEGFNWIILLAIIIPVVGAAVAIFVIYKKRK